MRKTHLFTGSEKITGKYEKLQIERALYSSFRYHVHIQTQASLSGDPLGIICIANGTSPLPSFHFFIFSEERGQGKRFRKDHAIYNAVCGPKRKLPTTDLDRDQPSVNHLRKQKCSDGALLFSKVLSASPFAPPGVRMGVRIMWVGGANGIRTPRSHPSFSLV